MKKVTKKDKKGDDHFEKGNYKQAIDTWWEAMNNDMSHLHFVRPTLLKVVKAHIKLGEYDKAVEEANKHVENEETVEGLHALGEALMAGDRFDEAIRTYQRAMEIAVSVTVPIFSMSCSILTFTNFRKLARWREKTMPTKSRRGTGGSKAIEGKELLQNSRCAT